MNKQDDPRRQYLSNLESLAVCLQKKIGIIRAVQRNEKAYDEVKDDLREIEDKLDVLFKNYDKLRS